MLVAASIALLLMVLCIAAALAILVASLVVAARGRPARPIQWIGAKLAFAACGLLVIFVVLAALTPSAEKMPRRTVAKPAAHHGAVPRYLVLSKGLPVFLGSNNEGDGMKGTLFDDLRTTEKWSSGASSDPAELPHRDYSVGTPLVVYSWLAIPGVPSPRIVVELRSKHSRRIDGYSWDIPLVPDVPPGTTLTVTGMGRYNPHEHVAMELTTALKSPKVDVPVGSLVRVIRYDPTEGGISPYRVVVTTGKARGATGYLGQLELGAPTHGRIADDEYDAKCDCVHLYFFDPNPHPADAT